MLGYDFNPHSPCGERPKLNRRVSSMHSFQSTLPLRGATGDVAEWFAESVISIHTPLAGSDRRRVVLCPAAGISIHTPLAGSDGRRRTSGRGRSYFNPHSPCGERPSKAENRKEAKAFQSTLPLRGATDFLRATGFVDEFQSTLPLRGATKPWSRVRLTTRFQSTLPLRGATWPLMYQLPSCMSFQSTLPLRGATSVGIEWSDLDLFQSTLPLRGATSSIRVCGNSELFQSTLPLRGATAVCCPAGTSSIFQSTLPLRGAT